VETEKEGLQPLFFIPFVDDPAQAEELWQGTKSFMEEQHGWNAVTDNRIFRLDYTHNSKEMEAEVGQSHAYGHPFTWDYVPDYDDPKAGEYVVAILENAGGPFLVCTNNRGFMRGEPILVGAGDLTRVVYFDGGCDDGEIVATSSEAYGSMFHSDARRLN